MISTVGNIIASIGVAISIAFVAFQTRQLVKQTKVSNGLAMLNARYSSLDRLHAAQTLLVQNPSMRPYFYTGAIPPDPSSDEGAKVYLAAEMLADAADYGLMALEIAPPIPGYDGWHDYAHFLIVNSPAVRQVAADHPAWYARLTQYMESPKEAIDRRVLADGGNVHAER